MSHPTSAAVAGILILSVDIAFFSKAESSLASKFSYTMHVSPSIHRVRLFHIYTELYQLFAIHTAFHRGSFPNFARFGKIYWHLDWIWGLTCHFYGGKGRIGHKSTTSDKDSQKL